MHPTALALLPFRHRCMQLSYSCEFANERAHVPSHAPLGHSNRTKLPVHHDKLALDPLTFTDILRRKALKVAGLPKQYQTWAVREQSETSLPFNPLGPPLFRHQDDVMPPSLSLTGLTARTPHPLVAKRCISSSSAQPASSLRPPHIPCPVTRPSHVPTPA